MKTNSFTQRFESFASTATRATGSSTAFLLALTTIIVWVFTGPLFGYSDTWQLVINTSTTIITFLMVFLIQKSQNKDSLAMQIKLNELIAVNRKASNRLLNVEDLSEVELMALHQFFGKLVEKAKAQDSLYETHSVEEAEEIHQEKLDEQEHRRKDKQSMKRTIK
ncbi:low affinity iron permease family protein [Spirosoma utsteinense]|uniref:Low affinity Fe/Cu permease n=1 Tax=Spirosoma utsteinense TaxID=2585773 RepID=A0ABR6WC83_9BACT|nr:low affinity iron permease family protein [Spirosoma utsteinense]MBC3786811.1 low affinity Fe/Cu permease [Spirosoma utsteinense]MBC3793768.1 low affinity Fe/Cu permease [Spirosoma utsteinense]